MIRVGLQIVPEVAFNEQSEQKSDTIHFPKYTTVYRLNPSFIPQGTATAREKQLLSMKMHATCAGGRDSAGARL